MKKLLAKVKGWGARVSVKRAGLILVLVGIVLSVSFLYKELSSIRRDLYAVRGDYYSADSENIDENYEEQQPPTVELLSQSVKEVRVTDPDSYKEDGSSEYKKQSVREVIVRVKNNYNYVYSVSSLGYANQKGVIVRPLDNLHAEDNQNEGATSDYYTYAAELAPGGETTFFLYFKDDNRPIDKLINLDEYYY